MSVAVSIGLLVALFPLIRSLRIVFGAPGDLGIIHRQMVNARPPATHEQRLIREVLASYPAWIIRPRTWLIVDDSLGGDAYVSGTTLYIDSGWFETPFFPAIVAHELGHLQGDDARLALALYRLIFPSFHDAADWCRQMAGVEPFTNSSIAEAHKKIAPGVSDLLFYGVFWRLLQLMGGGLGAMLCGLWWRKARHAMEYRADAFAAQHGYAELLADCLERIDQRVQDVDIRFPYVNDTHPPTVLRVQLMRDYARQHPEVVQFVLEEQLPVNERDLDVQHHERW
ncbi:M48 family metalloprotease [Herpetosiphon geysericola]|uniref:Peptidase M48 domain-containing protein n=1 Tax=Herpetosiphon geysericola TaxID=70996 RepID=A0A0P6XWQ9_9CHLR|nr:M48 family metalloprotease [Herpetosiphon geysericola]KPL79945.1 hypothetical protein SE18_25475 [Herpetosiphon geysericola]